jgi:hypothetical protein
MKSIFVCGLLLLVSCFSLAQNKYDTREDKLQQLKSRADIKVTEVEKDILKLEYPGGKMLYKNIGDYQYPESSIQQPEYSPTFDSTIIDLTTIDTTLYYHKYSFWQEVPLSNADFDYLRIGDINNNGKPELYGLRKYFESGFEPITVYELDESGLFQEIYQYDTVIVAVNIYDVTNDGWPEVHLTTPGQFGPFQQRFFSKPNDTSLATQVNIIFSPFEENNQLDDQTLGDFDADGYTDLLFDRHSPPYVYIFEYNPVTNNFDSIYRFQVPDPIDLGIGGYSVGDFDLDGKTEIVFSTVRGKVFVIENENDNQYTNSWQGMVETYNAYRHSWTDDIDKNGKPEFWVMGNAFYGNDAITRITIFETNGDNSYHAVGRIDLIGVFPFYAGNMQAIDIDGDGTEEVAICIDENFLILKFNGSKDHHSYEVYYIKKNEITASGGYSVYFGATMYDLSGNGNINILISMDEGNHNNTLVRHFTQIYKPDSLTSVKSDDDFIPKTTHLFQNYPNPFNPLSTVKFEISDLSNVSVKIYNILGKEITTLLEKQISPGTYTIGWEARDSNGQLLPSGVYLISLSANNKAGNYIHTIKALLLK